MKVRALFAVCVLALAGACTAIPPAKPESGSAAAFDLQGHRGARGLRPENTLAGFSYALELGVTTLELDCGVTADGVVVVSHDRLLNPDHTRTADGRFLDAAGPSLRALTYAQLRQYDRGAAAARQWLRGAASGAACGGRIAMSGKPNGSQRR